MKKGKIFLVLGLVLLFAASLRVFAQEGQSCTSDGDCYNGEYGRDLESYPPYCQDNKVWYSFSHFFTCDPDTSTCVDQGPGDYWLKNCDWNSNHLCQNGLQYTVNNICQDATCTIQQKAHTHPIATQACNYCSRCSFPAIEENSESTPVTDYSLGFDNPLGDESVIEGDHYIVAPNSTMYIYNIQNVDWYCANGVETSYTPSLVAWLYDATTGNKLAVGNNNLEIDDTLNRSNVIGESSPTTCGVPILNAFDGIFKFDAAYWNSVNDGIYDLYYFDKRSNYTLFADLISGYCGYSHEEREDTQNYICPWLGGTNRSNLCYDNDNKSVEGWIPVDNRTIIVPNPDISIDAPANESNPSTDSVNETWIITNTGTGKVALAINSICNGWDCSFDGYTEGTVIPTLDPGAQYTINMNITINRAELIGHQIGIRVTYDDGYSFASIPEQEKSSIMGFGRSIMT